MNIGAVLPPVLNTLSWVCTVFFIFFTIPQSVKCVLPAAESELCVYSSQKCGCGSGLFVCSMPQHVHIRRTNMYNWLMMLCELCEFKMYKNALVQLCKII